MFHNSLKLLCRFALSLAFALTAWVGTALAQSGGTLQPNVTETDNIEGYLNNHPGIAQTLHNNPSLINDPKWLSEHPEVKNWMDNHPAFKRAASANPQQFVNRSELDTLKHDHAVLNTTDGFMQNHPEMEKQLAANPNLINDPKYLASHPDLDRYLAQHPGVAQEWRAHPSEFRDAAAANYHYNQEHRAKTQPPVKKAAAAPQRAPQR
jgi:hypothetical protein